MTARIPLEDRLARYTEKTETCWLWTGTKDSRGYARMHVEKRNLGVHRISYELRYGPIPEGLVIDHLCFNPSCIRPEHLQAVTRRQNSENRSGLDADNTSGVRGVSWDPKNKRWAARVHQLGTTIHVGRFDTLQQAEAAVVAVRNALFTNNTLDRRPQAVISDEAKIRARLENIRAYYDATWATRELAAPSAAELIWVLTGEEAMGEAYLDREWDLPAPVLTMPDREAVDA